MASDVDVCNLALSHLGSDAQVASISPPDGSVEAGHCKRFFTLARREAIEHAPFTWAKKRVLLAEVTNPSSTWAHAYALPSDCIRPLRVLPGQELTSLEWRYDWMTATDPTPSTERGSAQYEIEGGAILTNQSEATLLYVRDVQDPAAWSPSFVAGLSYFLAGYLAGPIIKGTEGANAGKRLRDMGAGMLSSAATLDANRSHETAAFVPGPLAVR